MDDKWVSVQLPYPEEGVADSLLMDSFREILPGLEMFVPTLRFHDKRGEYCYSLFDGYVFVRGEYTDGDYLKLEDSPYVQQVLCYPGTSKIAYVSDAEVQQLRGKLYSLVPEKFEVDSEVNITQGLFSGLTGRVVAVEEDKVLVEIYMPLGSLTKLTTIPKIFLEPVGTSHDG